MIPLIQKVYINTLTGKKSIRDIVYDIQTNPCNEIPLIDKDQSYNVLQKYKLAVSKMKAPVFDMKKRSFVSHSAIRAFLTKYYAKNINWEKMG